MLRDKIRTKYQFKKTVEVKNIAIKRMRIKFDKKKLKRDEIIKKIKIYKLSKIK
jgi:hypothetical protein